MSRGAKSPGAKQPGVKRPEDKISKGGNGFGAKHPEPFLPFRADPLPAPTSQQECHTANANSKQSLILSPLCENVEHLCTQIKLPPNS